ncbi:MAG: hypothetical protein U0414_08710 [Polyangiaceae bacterium]
MSEQQRDRSYWKSQRKAHTQSVVAVAATFAFATLLATSLVVLLH